MIPLRYACPLAVLLAIFLLFGQVVSALGTVSRHRMVKTQPTGGWSAHTAARAVAWTSSLNLGGYTFLTQAQ